MNLNYTLSTIAEITNGNVVGNGDQIIKNIVIDSRLPGISETTMFVALKGVKSDGHQFCEAFVEQGGQILLVVNKQNINNVNQIVVDNVLIALQKIAAYHREQFNIPIIGITGSNGKTTVKEWLFHVLKHNFQICRSPKSYNSQIGVALSVLNLNKNHTLGIFEAGISQVNEMENLETIIKPTVGIFTGIGDAHQQNFDSIEVKLEEKFKLFENVETLIELKNNLGEFKIPFSDSASNQNANLVYQTATLLGVDNNAILNGLSSLPSISMRMEKMEGKNDCIILNDSYTLDEKSLEISINYLNSISESKQKVIIISPNENSYFSNEMIDLINTLVDYKVVLIGESNSYVKNITHRFKSVKEYLNNQLEFVDSAILLTGSRASKLEQILPTLMAKKHITKLKINLTAIRHNLNHYRSKLGAETKILAMVKAQSYGGGIVDMAKFLVTEKVNYFGVAYADEGVTLRENNIYLPIMVMNPEPEAFDDIIQHNLEPSIYSLDLLDDFISTLIRHDIKSFPIHIKLDTGMNRLGFIESEIDELIAQLNAQPEVYVKSVFSHLSVADNPKEEEFTKHQINVFKTINKRLNYASSYHFDTHIANSAATINYPDSHFDMVRLGIGMYGLLNENNSDLQPALSFHTQISQIKTLSKGDSVGYGRTFKASKNTKIAIIPVGYADGLRRQLGQGNWSVLIKGELFPIVGNICMDMCMVDVTSIDTKVGDEVQIFGTENSVFKMSKTLNTIPYEIISSISSRVHRVYLEG